MLKGSGKSRNESSFEHPFSALLLFFDTSILHLVPKVRQNLLILAIYVPRRYNWYNGKLIILIARGVGDKGESLNEE